MTLLIFGLAFCVGGFLGVVGMALAAASKDAEDHWTSYERGYRDGRTDAEWPVMGLN